MSPIASCLHYATQCFEGLKVYRGYDGKLRLFRPDKNCARLLMSAQRVALPPFDPKELEKLIMAFLKVDGPSMWPYLPPTLSYLSSYLFIANEERKEGRNGNGNGNERILADSV